MDPSLTVTNRQLVSLDDEAALDSTLVGSKAANLAALLRAGFPVPQGVVITTAARDASDLLLGEIRTRLADTPMAARSSATAEDLPNASYAAQYETFLGVEGDAGLAKAIEACRASLHSTRVEVYSDGARETSMAVLIQPMVDADAAGVAFSSNPVIGARDQVVVNAVEGLGDRLVSGEVTPDQWVVDGEFIKGPEGVLSRSRVLDVAGLAKQVEAHFGTPQDIEWAIEDDTLWLLQARPITSLPEPSIEPISIDVDVPPGYWEHDASHSPRPSYPIESFIPSMVSEAVKSWATEFGYLFDGIEFRDIGGATKGVGRPSG